MALQHRNRSENRNTTKNPHSFDSKIFAPSLQANPLTTSQPNYLTLKPNTQANLQTSIPNSKLPNSTSHNQQETQPTFKPSLLHKPPLGTFARHLPPTNPSAVPSSALQTPSGNLPHQDKSSCQARRRGSIIRTILKLWENCGG